ncbi:YajQ family cyclic di-GMP-binding protein [Psychromonas sp. 14N.309.X.WAT.B.A12]|uniref:YajQ family cyclic di-GMP-binding protein n=1 Tax=unclassified Psychromonas TaxID=2614957 RepID=UPI0025B1F09B|nr:YajQ family cyclic di-GMP-binding protein [Psychromonas sp. 14N.309.X.WAT.B.A12]MDN2661930.1 YajQ family cyclic di-GMP-binding protein [Psychromonas sp. 14N.309.X.WAT.B.A12]
MPSFDIVSEIDLVEVKNAVDNTSRELGTRYDFRGVKASITLNKEVVKLEAEAEMQINALRDMLRANLVKRGVDTRSMDPDKYEQSGKFWSQNVKFKVGVDQPTAKKLVKHIKDSKMKVQVSIQGDQLRVTGKKRDDLQQAMRLVKECDLGMGFQFNNFKD